MSKKIDFKAQSQRLQQASVISYIALAILAIIFMSGTTYQLVISYLAKDDLASKMQTVFTPAAHAFFDIQLKWVVVVLLVLSAIVPYLYLMQFKGKYQTGLKDKILPLRWVDLAVTSAIMIEVTALLSGINDIFVLKISAGLIVISYLLAWVAEKQNSSAKKPVLSVYAISVAAGLLPWILIVVAALATPFYSGVRSPWYVYAIYATTLVSFGLTAINQLRSFKGIGQWKDYIFTERNYTLISLVTKITFAAILIVGLKK